MKGSSTFLMAIFVLGVLAVPARPASAQDLPPDQAGGTGASNNGRSLDLTGWLGSGFDARSARWAAESVGIDPALTADNAHAQAGLGLSFTRTRPRTLFSADLQSGLRGNSATVRPLTSDHRGTLAFGLSLSRRTRVDVRQMVKYAAVNPFAALSSAATDDLVDVTPPGSSQPYLLRQALSAVTGTVVSHTLGRRTTAVATHSYGYTQGDFGGALESHSVGGRLDRRVNGSMTARFGYRLTNATYDPLSRKFLKTHDIDTGIDYRRQLPFSRRTSITASTGTSIVDDRDLRTVRVIGDVTLLHPISRSWIARVTYSRPVQVMEGMAAPLVSNAIGGVLAGDVGRRHRLVATADYFKGYVSLARSSATSVEGASALVRWRAGLSRRLAINTEAFGGKLRFGRDVATVSGVAPDSMQFGIRAFISFSRSLLID
jgi:hypothetical protein